VRDDARFSDTKSKHHAAASGRCVLVEGSQFSPWGDYMAVNDRLALLSETEEELQEESPLDLDFEEELELMPIAELEMTPTRCPVDEPRTVREFDRYSEDISLLPNDQQKKLVDLSVAITKMVSGLPDVHAPDLPEAQVLVAGHADLDAARERREPGFLKIISEKRALAAFCDLRSRVDLFSRTRINWILVGRGVSALAVSNPRTEAERKCNRRVEIMLVPPPQARPHLNANQRGRVNTDREIFREFFSVALQGTSGQYDKPQVAEKKAREIAERILPFLERRVLGVQKTKNECENDVGFLDLFKDALQGTASKFGDPDDVIKKASEIAEQAVFGALQARRKLEWKRASLPQSMGGDCEIEGKLPGGLNQVLCRTHSHIIDTTTRMVIAHDLEEYKKHPR
jgi:outer membrane protein OmpA-like peptidoglycan-associated protein